MEIVGAAAEMAVVVVVGSVMGEVAEVVAGALEAVGATEVEIWCSATALLGGSVVCANRSTSPYLGPQKELHRPWQT